MQGNTVLIYCHICLLVYYKDTQFRYFGANILFLPTATQNISHPAILFWHFKVSTIFSYIVNSSGH